MQCALTWRRFLSSLPAAAAVEAGLSVISAARNLAQRQALCRLLCTLAGCNANSACSRAASNGDAGAANSNGGAAGAVPEALLLRLGSLQLGLAALARLPAPWDARLAHLAGAPLLETHPEPHYPGCRCWAWPGWQRPVSAIGARFAHLSSVARLENLPEGA